MHVPFWMRQHAPQIFSSIAALSATASVGFAVTGTIKACDAVREMEAERGVKPTRKEVLKEVWPYYIPSGASLGLSLVTMMLSRRASARQTAAALSLYSVSNAMLADYQANVREKLGEKQAEAMEHDIATRHALENPPQQGLPAGENYAVYETGYGDTLFRDDMFGPYFRSDWEAVRRGVNDVNTQINDETYATLTDLYQAWNIPVWKGGNDIVWNVGEQIHIDKIGNVTVVEMPNGEKCHCLTYNLPGQGHKLF
jgi:hypothetical protein